MTIILTRLDGTPIEVSLPYVFIEQSDFTHTLIKWTEKDNKGKYEKSAVVIEKIADIEKKIKEIQDANTSI